MIAHIIVIDRKTANVGFLVTPPDRNGGLPLDARTTSQFLEEFNLQIAINGDGFELCGRVVPWIIIRTRATRTPLGFTASNKDVYRSGRTDIVGVEPTLYITREHYPSFNKRKPEKIWSAISGEHVSNRGVVDGLDNITLETAKPPHQRQWTLRVSDRRQPYSDGATRVAELLRNRVRTLP
jgi:hypothetical protein